MRLGKTLGAHAVDCISLEIVNVKDRAPGKDCQCVCRFCHKPVVAKHFRSGSKKSHFAHLNDEDKNCPFRSQATEAQRQKAICSQFSRKATGLHEWVIEMLYAADGHERASPQILNWVADVAVQTQKGLRYYEVIDTSRPTDEKWFALHRLPENCFAYTVHIRPIAEMLFEAHEYGEPVEKVAEILRSQTRRVTQEWWGRTRVKAQAKQDLRKSIAWSKKMHKEKLARRAYRYEGR
jgi:L-rhamnose mutarotase